MQFSLAYGETPRLHFRQSGFATVPDAIFMRWSIHASGASSLSVSCCLKIYYRSLQKNPRQSSAIDSALRQRGSKLNSMRSKTRLVAVPTRKRLLLYKSRTVSFGLSAYLIGSKQGMIRPFQQGPVFRSGGECLIIAGQGGDVCLPGSQRPLQGAGRNSKKNLFVRTSDFPARLRF